MRFAVLCWPMRGRLWGRRSKVLTGTVPSRVGNRTEKALKRLNNLIAKLKAEGVISGGGNPGVENPSARLPT